MNSKFLICTVTTVALLAAFVALVTADGENGDAARPKNRMGGRGGGKHVCMMKCLVDINSTNSVKRQDAQDFQKNMTDTMTVCGFSMSSKTEGRNFNMTSRNMSDKRVRGEHMKGQGSGGKMVFTDEQKQKIQNKTICVMNKAGIISEKSKFNMDVLKELVGKVVKTEAQESFLKEMKNCTVTNGITESDGITVDDVQMKNMIGCVMTSAKMACESIRPSKLTVSTNNNADTNDEAENSADE